MNRPIRLVTAALTVSAALLLAACGSGGGDASDKIEGADSNGGGKASASASAKPKGVEARDQAALAVHGDLRELDEQRPEAPADPRRRA